MRPTRPLFRPDPGWLFIIAGLAVCAAGVLLPAQADLRALGEQRAQLQAEEAHAYQRLAAHADFIDQVERGEPAMIKRLATAQLNLVPSTDKPLLLASTDASPVTEWIDATVDLDMRPSRAAGLSTLSRWASGPSRLWLFGGGIMAVFIGLLISPDRPGKSRRVVRNISAGMGAAAVWRSGGVVGPGEPVPTTTSESNDIAWQSAVRIAEELEDTPSIAVDDYDLSQSADTIDLEDDELVPAARNVIEDDLHDLEADHAAEVVVQAREIAPERSDRWQESVVRNVRAADKDDSAPGASVDEGLSRAEATLLLDPLTAEIGSLKRTEMESAGEISAASSTIAAADATAERTTREQARGRTRRRGPMRQSTRKAQPPTSMQEEPEISGQSPEGNPSASPEARCSEDDDVTSIPFLRHRQDLHVDDGREVSDDAEPSDNGIASDSESIGEAESADDDVTTVGDEVHGFVDGNVAVEDAGKSDAGDGDEHDDDDDDDDDPPLTYTRRRR